MTATRRRYTKAEKAAVVGVALAKGQTAASEESGIPLSTVHYWYTQPEFVELRTTARSDVADSMWSGVQLGVAAMVEALRDPKVPLRDKTDATSMLAEKYLLLKGEATSRSETRALTEGLDDHEKARLREILDEALSAEVPKFGLQTLEGSEPSA